MIERRHTTKQNYFVSQFQAGGYNMKRTIGEVLAFYDRSFGRVDEDTRFELKVVINELLNNAIKHGGCTGAACNVKVVAGMLTADCAFLIVEDNGNGYDTARLNRYRETAKNVGGVDSVEETGRGIYIVKSLCEDFMVNEKGNKVVVNKRLRRAEAV
jgi:serine/threonine-protein kinase RsbW